MANYAREKANYGGVCGTIQIFTTALPLANNPSDIAFLSKVPAGFLKCNGGIRKAADFPALAAIIGTGQNCKFKKPSQILDADQIQLPDLGSKVIIAGSGVGEYLGDTVETDSTPQKKVGVSVELVSNVGNTIALTYSGNFNVLAGAASPLLRNPRVTFPSGRKVGDFILDESNFQAHGHDGNQTVLNFIGNHAMRNEIGPQAGGGNTASGSALASNSVSDTSATTISKSHTHTFPAPTSFPHNFTYAYAAFSVPADNIVTTLNLSVKNVKKLDEAVSPFVLVEYIIKY